MEHRQKKTYSDVQSAFESHAILQSAKADLEEFLIAIATTRVLDPANQVRTAEMGDTIRMLLAARQSEEMHSQASKIARIDFCCCAYLFRCAGLLHEGQLQCSTSPSKFDRKLLRQPDQQLRRLTLQFISQHLRIVYPAQRFDNCRGID